jgi:hypothetical protein
MDTIINNINAIGLQQCLCPKDEACSCVLDLGNLSDNCLQETEILITEIQELAMDLRKETPTKPLSEAEIHIYQMYVAALLDPTWKTNSPCRDCKLTMLTRTDEQGVETVCSCAYNFYPYA